jgi:bacteriocin biosynthesis cyclodehydratase domain-containing protein
MSERRATLDRMRPALKPGLLAVWRNRDTVQIGVDPRRAVALTGMRGAAVLLGLLDGSRDLAQLLAAAGEFGISAEVADRIITLLAAGGALHDFPGSAFRAMPHGLRTRLAPELATAALAHGDGDGGARILARRQDACVRVEGLSRVGLCVASMLTASGVGMVISTGRPPGAGPGPAPPPLAGPPPPSGSPTPTGSAPPTGSPPPTGKSVPAGTSRGPDLVILADTYRRELPEVLKRDKVPHLAVAASEAIGVVGPLVLPGDTACLRCLDLTRAERDPAWPLILAQLTGGGADPPACDTVLAAAVAAQAAAQTLAVVDRPASASAVTNGTLELVLPDWQWRRRTWEPHDRCGCGRRSIL